MLRFFFILICSFVITNVLFTIDLGPFRSIRNFLMGFGIMIHEVCHAIVCLLTGVKISEIVFLKRIRNPETGNSHLHGHVKLKLPERLTFLQDLIISIAPLIISTWLFFWCLEIAFMVQMNDFIVLIAGFACISLLMGASPSSGDIASIPSNFSKDIRYSLYQVILVSISIISIGLVAFTFHIVMVDFLLYIIIGVGYYVLKYSISGISKGFDHFNRRSHRSFRYSRFIRRTHKPIGSQIEEAHW